MDYEEFRAQLIEPNKLNSFFYNRNGELSLILNSRHDFMEEEEIVDYLLGLPQIYDKLSMATYESLMDENLKMGIFIRTIFGMYIPSNPHSMVNEDVGHYMSPENISYRILKKIWYNIHII